MKIDILCNDGSLNEYCCADFAVHVDDDYTNGAFVKYDNMWAINGCCGGGCFVVANMKFCPFCGVEIAEND